MSMHLRHHYRRRYHHYCFVLVTSAVVVSIAVSTSTTCSLFFVRITHCTFTPGPGKTHVLPASLSLAVSPLVLHSWLLPEMQNEIEIKKRKEKVKLVRLIAKKKYNKK